MGSSTNRLAGAKRKQDLTKTNKRSATCSDPIPTQSEVEKAGVLKLALEEEGKTLITGTEWRVDIFTRCESTAAHDPFFYHREPANRNGHPSSATPPLRPTLHLLDL